MKPNDQSVLSAQATGEQKPAVKRGVRRGLALLCVLGILAAGGAFLLHDSEGEAAVAPTPAEVVMQLLPSEIHEVKVATLRDSVHITGSLAPMRELTISAEVSGRIETINLREGDRVSTGDEMVTIDVETLRNQLEQQQATARATLAQLELARAQLKRTGNLVQRGVSSSSSLETETANVGQLEASYAALLKQVASAEDNLAKARIAAPFEGVIASRSINPGAYVSAGSELLQLVDVSGLDLKAGVPVVYAPLLKVGQKVSLRVDGISGQSFQGEIDRIAPVAVSGTRVLPVYAHIDNDADLLKGGMFATGDLVLEEAEARIGIPAAAVRNDQQGDFVLKLVDGRVVRQSVEVARDWNRGRTKEIASGLNDGDVIVAVPMDRLRDGMRVARVEG